MSCVALCERASVSVQAIAKGLKMRGAPGGHLASWHHLFWLGALNSRVALGRPTDFRAGRPSPALAAQFQRELARAQAARTYRRLVQHDQLLAARRAGAAFADFQEPPLEFPPTFKARPRRPAQRVVCVVGVHMRVTSEQAGLAMWPFFAKSWAVHHESAHKFS